MPSPPTQPPPTLDAGPVVLRRWELDWVDGLDAAIDASKPELQRFMPWATDEHGVEQSRTYLEQSVKDWDAGENFNYAILTPGGAVVGSCGLLSRMGPGVLEIGYWVHTAHAGHGYATAAAGALAEAGLALPGIERIAIKHDIANPASGRVAAKAGFTQVGQVEHEPATAEQTGVDLVWERR